MAPVVERTTNSPSPTWGAQGVGGPLTVVGERGALDGAPAVPVGLGEGLFLGDGLGEEGGGEGGEEQRRSGRAGKSHRGAV